MSATPPLFARAQNVPIDTASAGVAPDGSPVFPHLELQGRTTLRVRADLVFGSWNGAVVALEAKVTPQDVDWLELSTANRLSSAGVTNPIDVSGLWAVRARVITASGTSGSRATIGLCATPRGFNSNVTTHNLLSATHPDTNPDSVVLGDLIAGNSTPAWARLPGSTSSQRAILIQKGTGSISAVPAWLADDPLLYGVDVRERTLYPALGTFSVGSVATVQPSSGTAYFVYLGRVASAFTPKYVKLYQAAAGTGSQTAEVGLFSSTTPPNKANLTLTKIVATGTVDDMTTGSPVMKGNTSAFATSVAAGTYLWAGARIVMGSSQPTCGTIRNDLLTGAHLVTTGASALTGAGPFTGSLTTNANDPLLALIATLD